MNSQTKTGPKKQSPQQDDPEQSKRFLEAAEKHGAAKTEEEARKAFKKAVAKPKRGNSDG